MLSSPGNQYLRPEYLTPLPTTLDAKKSPLALLAQTCSQIGADAPNAKLIQSAEKSSRSNKSESSKEKSTPIDLQSKSREKSRTPEERSNTASVGSRVRTPSTTKSVTSGSNGSANSPRASPANSERKTPAESSMSPEAKNGERTSPHTPASSASKTAFTPNILTSSSDPAIKDLPLGTFKPGVPVTSSFLPGYPGAGFPLPIDLMTSSLMSHHHALKANGLNPYLNYGRLKPAEMCRDPYCTGCGMSAHLLGGGSVKTSPGCPAGCTQCDHSKPASSAAAAAAYLGQNHAAAAYAHAQLAALAAASHLPYVCNWISGDAAYCGKRFSSSEELLSHLRTHTTSVAVSSENNPLSSMPTHPLLHRTYPTPPLSPLATARYHPYSKPSLLPPSLSSFPLSHPGLPPYLTPYSLYGPRLGTAPGMHP